MRKLTNRQIEKNGQAPSIAPLQPPTLAVFPPWGSSEGAGRKRLARHKGVKIFRKAQSYANKFWGGS